MKKSILIVAVTVLVLPFISFARTSCAAGDKFDFNTGKPCTQQSTQHFGCQPGDKYNIYTGEFCYTIGTPGSGPTMVLDQADSQKALSENSANTAQQDQTQIDIKKSQLADLKTQINNLTLQENQKEQSIWNGIGGTYSAKYNAVSVFRKQYNLALQKLVAQANALAQEIYGN